MAELNGIGGMGETVPRPGARSRVVGLGCWMLTGFLLVPSAGRAQRFGRWWWDADAKIKQAQSDNLRDGTRLSRFEQQGVEFGIGLNGFVLHPAVGDFRVGVDFLVTDVDGGRAIDSDSLGFDASLNLFPQGDYRASFFLRREQWDHSGPSEEDLFTLLGLPETSTRMGGRFELRRGFLRGTLLGLDYTEIDFLSPNTRRDDQARHFLAWSRSGKKVNSRLRLEHHRREFGTVDLDIEDFTAILDEHGSPTAKWRWEVNSVAVLRDLASAGSTRSTDDYRLGGRLLHDVRERDEIELRYNVAATRFDDDARDGHVLSTFYRWRPRERWEISPFALYSLQSSDRFELRSPRIGLRVAWHLNEPERPWSYGFGSRVSYGTTERIEDGFSIDQTDTAYGFTASVAHGDENRLRKELEAEMSRNEIRFDRVPTLDLPDLDIMGIIPGSQDFDRARASLRRRWDSRSVTLWLERSRRATSDRLQVEDISSETSQGTVQFGGRRLNVQAETGETEARRASGIEQKIRFFSSSVSYRPHRNLQMHALLRNDERELVFGPDIDGERLEAGLDWRFGQLNIEARVWERTQQLVGGSETTNRGFNWSISRQLAGWLPIVTGAQRRGVIR